ncbi:MAG: hypothetical protein LBP37_02580 [Spirochaetaceae bacterium]|jgi:hypothetical protein|nr:hypothetical protein [Spirochaetaceae bacterium]
MMIAIPENIETRKSPLKDGELKEAEKNIRHFFNSDRLSLTDAGDLYHKFFGAAMRGKLKNEKMENSVNDFLFTGSISFEKWFMARPPDARRILYAAVFEEYIGVDVLEKTLNTKIKIVKEKWGVSYLDNEYNLDFLTATCDDYDNDTYHIGIEAVYRAALLPWFTPPPETRLENCVCTESGNAAAYNNSAEITEFMPLFCEALNDILNDRSLMEKDLYRTFAKKTINGLYAASGFPPFPFETERALAQYSPAASDMLAHFLFFMADFRSFPRPQNPAEFLRDILKLFFEAAGKKNQTDNIWITDNLEYNMLFNHLSKTAMYSQIKISDIFYLRDMLKATLLAIAEDGRVFDACALVKRLKYSGGRLSLFSNIDIRYLKVKADKIILETKIEKDPWEVFRPAGTLRFDFIEKPLFLGYFYLCASLGILEITQAPPPLVCERNGKMFPVSLFDSLKTVKITGFGLWCLGLSAEPPAMEKGKYEAIADKELFLVTVRGKSLERTIFLDRIGEKLGADRWRINPSTFIAGCENKTQIEERVEKFHRLIDPAPAQHWEKLFKTALERANFLEKQFVDALVYRLPFDTPAKREVSAELLADPELRGIAMRAEGGLLVVPYRSEKRFFALLAAHGIACFGNQK